MSLMSTWKILMISWRSSILVFDGFSSQGLTVFMNWINLDFIRGNLTKARVLHFLIFIEEEIEFPADT
jgi:hypothetical protein